VAPPDRRKLLAHFTLCRRMAGRISTDLRLHQARAGQAPAYVEISSLPFGGPRRAEQGYKSVISDVSARRRAEESLRRAHDELEQRVRQRTRELTRANRRLQREIEARRKADQALRESEQRLRLMIEGTRDYAIFLLDTHGRVTTWNAGAAQITGYRAREILHHHFSRFYTPEDICSRKPWRLLELAQATGRAEDEGWRVRKGGSRFWASAILTAVYDEHRQLRGFLKVTRDITERREAQEVLRSSEKNLADFFEHSPFGLLFIGPHGQVRRANSAALEIFGCSLTVCLSRRVQEFFAEPASSIIADGKRRSFLPAAVAGRSMYRCGGGLLRTLLAATIPSQCWALRRYGHAGWLGRTG
jgi:PAS domain S-box-containing protein